MKKRLTALLICLTLLLSSLVGHTLVARADTEPVLGEAPPETAVFAAESTESPSAFQPMALSDAQKTAEILKRQAALRKYTAPKVLYTTNPVYSGGKYVQGKLKPEVLQNALDHLNYIRFIAGLPSVSLDAALCDNAQYGTTLMAATNTFAHNVPQSKKPKAMSQSFFDQGNKALGSSNIGMGYENIAAFTYGCVNDSDPGNIVAVGHRAWLLNHQLKSIGFGKTLSYYATKVFDTSGTPLPAGQYVAWPSAGVFPVNLMNDGWNQAAWSIHFGFGDYDNLDKAAVTLTRTRDKKQWKFSASSSPGGAFYRSGGYGYTNALIFSPKGISGYKSGDIFTVNITGLRKYNVSADKYVSTTIQYTVKMINADILTALSISPKSKTMAPGASARLTAKKTPSGSLETLTWKSSNPSVATVSQNGVVKAKKIGSATITLTALNGKKATCTITVQKPVPERYVSLRIGKSRAIQNGKKTTIDTTGTKPFKTDGRTMLPIRFVSEKMGAKVKYINDKKPIVIRYGAKTVTLKLGSKSMTVTETGKKTKIITLEVAAQKKGGRTFIPLRAVGQALGFNVHYQPGSEIIVVSNPKPKTATLNARIKAAKTYITK